MILDAESACARHKAVAVGFALLADEIGVRGAENHIDRVGPALQDRRHGVDDEFDTLARREQPERQNDGPVAEAQLGLRLLGLNEWKIGSPVRDDLDLVCRHPIHGAQQLSTFLRHDDDPRRYFDDAIHDIALRRGRLGQDGVQRRDDRHGQPRQQRHDVAARFATEDAEFMLETDDFELARIQEIGRPHVVLDFVIVDLKAHDGRIVVGMTVIGHRHDRCFHLRRMMQRPPAAGRS